MSKIWEVDFTSFSGSSNVLYDMVGSNHLTVFNGTMNKQDPLIGFDNRRGVYFSVNGSAQKYVLYESGIINITEARFTASYSYRSFVLWIRPVGLGSGTSYWEFVSGGRNGVWGADTGGFKVIGLGSDGSTLEVCDGSSVLISPGNVLEPTTAELSISS